MNEETTSEVRLLDFDTIQQMLKEGVVQSLIGYTIDGQMLVAAPNVSDLTLIEEKYPPPQSSNLMAAYMGVCCAHKQRHWPIWSPFGLVCQDLRKPCGSRDVECGPCIHTHG